MGDLHFIINPASGGGAGAALANALRVLMGNARVDLVGRCDPVAIVAGLTAADAVVACGGDGTASSLSEPIAARGVDGPALGVVPLGTGNDLARVLGWRVSQRGDLPGLLQALRTAERRSMDRWRLSGPGLQRSWCNYLSLGLDAAAALRFHRLRQQHPGIARGGLLNQALYGILGAQTRGPELARLVHLPAGPALPTWASGLVCTNIPSYAGGVVLAQDMRCDDGRLEVVALGQGISLGLVTARLRRPRLLARPQTLAFSLGASLPMQADGEPFLALAGAYRIERAHAVRVLVAVGAPCAL